MTPNQYVFRLNEPPNKVFPLHIESNEIQTIKGYLLSKITLNEEEWEERGRPGKGGGIDLHFLSKQEG